MAAITIEDIIESNRMKKERVEIIKNDLKGIMSQSQLDKLEEVFMSCTNDCIFKWKEK